MPVLTNEHTGTPRSSSTTMLRNSKTRQKGRRKPKVHQTENNEIDIKDAGLKFYRYLFPYRSYNISY